MALMHEDFFTLGWIFTLAGFVVEEFYCMLLLLLYAYIAPNRPQGKTLNALYAVLMYTCLSIVIFIFLGSPQESASHGLKSANSQSEAGSL